MKFRESHRLALLWSLVAISAINAVGVTLAVSSGWGGLHVPCVLGASTSFVLVAVVGGGLRSGYGRFMIAGLIACWLGDVLGSPYFLTGLVAFCFAHIAFIGAFITKGIVWKRAGIATLPMTIALAVILRWLLPNVQQPTETIGVCVYATLISSMVLAAAGASEGPAGRILLSGAVIIFISDIVVSGWKYAGLSTDAGRFCYPLYYSACLLFALSVYAREPFLKQATTCETPEE